MASKELRTTAVCNGQSLLPQSLSAVTRLHFQLKINMHSAVQERSYLTMKKIHITQEHTVSIGRMKIAILIFSLWQQFQGQNCAQNCHLTFMVDG